MPSAEATRNPAPIAPPPARAARTLPHPGEPDDSGALPARIAWSRVDSPFGPVLLAAADGLVAALHFIGGPEGFPAARAALAAAWPDVRRDEAPAAVAPLAARLFGTAAPGQEAVGLLLRGTGFQLSVWRALLEIPAGATTSYAELAVRIGHAGAARAVGGAVGANSVGWLVPCHRVLRADGSLGGYRWGAELKRALLAAEASAAG